MLLFNFRKANALLILLTISITVISGCKNKAKPIKPVADSVVYNFLHFAVKDFDRYCGDSIDAILDRIVQLPLPNIYSEYDSIEVVN